MFERAGPGRLAVQLVAVACAVALGGCSSSNHSTSRSSTTTTARADQGASNAEYCAQVANLNHVLSTNGTGSVQAWITGFSRLAEAYRTLTPSAPSNVRSDAERLAESSHYTSTRLAKLAPTTMKQLRADLKKILTTENRRYGDLTRETSAVVASARDRCGIALG
jgi:hypothetical protein